MVYASNLAFTASTKRTSGLVYVEAASRRLGVRYMGQNARSKSTFRPFRPAAMACATLAGFFSGAPSASSHTAIQKLQPGAEYVALGSSFAAGPGVGARAPDSPPACSQSLDNFAHLLARKRGLRVIDRSCSATTTVDILQAGKFGLPAQIDAVGPATKLVTVTTGGNDVAYLGNLYAWSCALQPGPVPASIQKPLCAGAPDEVVEARFKSLKAAFLRIAAAVRLRAPTAVLVFVDYTTILPERGSCPDRLPLAEERLNQGRDVGKRLSRLTAEAARESGARLVMASALTRGHDVCSADPWVFGWAFPKRPGDFGPIAYHPNEEAMQAIADALDSAL